MQSRLSFSYVYSLLFSVPVRLCLGIQDGVETQGAATKSRENSCTPDKLTHDRARNKKYEKNRDKTVIVIATDFTT